MVSVELSADAIFMQCETGRIQKQSIMDNRCSVSRSIIHIALYSLLYIYFLYQCGKLSGVHLLCACSKIRIIYASKLPAYLFPHYRYSQYPVIEHLFSLIFFYPLTDNKDNFPMLHLQISYSSVSISSLTLDSPLLSCSIPFKIWS